MTKLLDTSVAEEKDLLTTEHIEAEARIAEVKSAHDAVMKVMNPEGRTPRTTEVTGIESALKRKESDAVSVRTLVAERMEVIDLLARLEEARGAMDVLMEGPDHGGKKRLFAKAFKVLEDRITALAAGATLDEEGRVEARNFCCIPDNISTAGIVLDTVRSSMSQHIRLEDLPEIRDMLKGHGMPFNPETEKPISLDYIRRRMEVVMSIMTFKREIINKEGEIDSHDFHRLCAVISETFSLDKAVVTKTLGNIMKRTLKKILAERAAAKAATSVAADVSTTAEAK